MQILEKTSYVLGSELWEQNFKSLVSLVREFIVNVWEVRKQKVYGDDSCPNQLQSQFLPGGLGGATGVEGQRNGKFVNCIVFVMHVEYLLLHVMSHVRICTCGCKCRCDNVHSCTDTSTCMCSSAHSCGWVADGGDAIEYYYYNAGHSYKINTHNTGADEFVTWK